MWLRRRWFVGSHAKSAIDQHDAKGWRAVVLTFGITDRLTQTYIHAYGDASSNADTNGNSSSNADTNGNSSSNADTNGDASSDTNARAHNRG